MIKQNYQISWFIVSQQHFIFTMPRMSSFKQTLKYFCQSTTIHGVYNLYSSNGFAVRLTWAAILLAMVSCTIGFCTLSVLQYLRFDIKTSITYDTDDKFEFPAITFCNQFPGIRSLVGSNSVLLYSFVTFLTDKPGDIPRAILDVRHYS